MSQAVDSSLSSRPAATNRLGAKLGDAVVAFALPE
jgi:hypothetical protein